LAVVTEEVPVVLRAASTSAMAAAMAVKATLIVEIDGTLLLLVMSGMAGKTVAVPPC
jgi:hypothetical protein